MPTFASRAIRFFATLTPPRVPRGVQVMNPYADARVRRLVRQFLQRYYDDTEPRILMIGINPGRFGGGITGISFTDPVALADNCGIENHFARRRELSSEFIYRVVDRCGGAERFFARVFLTAVSPLGFTRSGVNLNYYDLPALAASVEPFAVRTLRRQIAMGARSDVAIVLGKGENLRFVERMNERHRLFGELVALEHPRWVMQYRRPRIDEYADAYATAIRSVARRRPLRSGAPQSRV
jgi:hypothetical protein